MRSKDQVEAKPTRKPAYKDLILQQDRRIELKKPLGDLWVGSVITNIRRLKKLLKTNKPTCIATVGDFVSSNVLDADIHPDLVIVDHRIMREAIEPIEIDREFVTVVNEAGTISAETQAVLKGIAEDCKNLAVIVDGEEDLLVLPLMVYMPLGSMIIYGQPREGMVVIILTQERKDWARGFMDQMQKARPRSNNP